MGDLWNGIAGRGTGKGVSRQCGKDFCGVQAFRGERGQEAMRWFERAKTRNGAPAKCAAARAALILSGAALAQIAGCSKKEAPAVTAPVAETSAIRVSKEADGIHVVTPVAEFVLSGAGYLKG